MEQIPSRSPMKWVLFAPLSIVASVLAFFERGLASCHGAHRVDAASTDGRAAGMTAGEDAHKAGVRDEVSDGSAPELC